MIKNWLIVNDEELDNKIVIFKQINEFPNYCVNDIEKISLKKISELRGNIVLSAIGYEMGYKNDKEESFNKYVLLPYFLSSNICICIV